MTIEREAQDIEARINARLESLSQREDCRAIVEEMTGGAWEWIDATPMKGPRRIAITRRVEHS